MSAAVSDFEALIPPGEFNPARLAEAVRKSAIEEAINEVIRVSALSRLRSFWFAGLRSFGHSQDFEERTVNDAVFRETFARG